MNSTGRLSRSGRAPAPSPDRTSPAIWLGVVSVIWVACTWIVTSHDAGTGALCGFVGVFVVLACGKVARNAS